ncbi:trypsin-like serine peptidase [Marivita sp. S2033]|uniref:trypsin-like serine peptidase n=1 Tax=Marivita sp. S2033 TaxID=3373187 RepID=UPI003982A58F
MFQKVFALILLGLATTAPAQDLPVLPAQDHADWQAVGRVNASGYRKRDMCTGTLIAPDQVLTAAHCVSGIDGVGPLPGEITFVAGWLRGAASDSVKGNSIWVHPMAYAEGSLDVRYDIAVLTLERAASVTELPVATARATAPFAILGYSSRRPHMLGASFTCGGVYASRILRLDCPVQPGNSGGPVMSKSGDDWVVSAVISAKGQGRALAVPVSRLSAR